MYNAADGILILAGAGMGVDSGIPDFRGKSGVWSEAKTNFLKFASAASFNTIPLEAWNFYITRLLAYTKFEPHCGYYDLLTLEKDVFVITSNVDGQFEKAGYALDKTMEIHGDLRTIQCMRKCNRNTHAMPSFTSIITTIKDIPVCSKCGSYMRPQVMMFNDPLFLFNKVDDQADRFREWRDSKTNILGIEIGAGTVVPSIRLMGQEHTSALIRINPHDTDITRNTDVTIPETAVNGIALLLKILKETL